MRVLYLTEESISFSDALVRGGAIHVRNVVTGLRKRGHEVILLDWNETPECSFQVSVDPRTRFIDGPLRTLSRAVRVGKRRNIDVIISKTRKTYLSGLLTARILGIPHFVHVGSSLNAPTDGVLDQLSAASLTTRLRAPHDGYLTVCEYIAAQLRGQGVSRDRIFNVRNAVNITRFHPETVPTSLADRYRNRINSGKTPDELCLGYVGGLQSYKGLYDLADAVNRMNSEWHLVVAGSGPERDQLADDLGERATFLGSVPYAQIPALYHEFDALVLPSHTEGLPRVVLEAHATATAVIATRVGGVPEVIEDGETGLLCDPHRPVELATLLDRLATDANERDRLGRLGREAVESEFSWPALYSRYEQCLKQVTE